MFTLTSCIQPCAPYIPIHMLPEELQPPQPSYCLLTYFFPSISLPSSDNLSLAPPFDAAHSPLSHRHLKRYPFICSLRSYTRLNVIPTPLPTYLCLSLFQLPQPPPPPPPFDSPSSPLSNGMPIGCPFICSFSTCVRPPHSWTSASAPAE